MNNVNNTSQYSAATYNETHSYHQIYSAESQQFTAFDSLNSTERLTLAAKLNTLMTCATQAFKKKNYNVSKTPIAVTGFLQHETDILKHPELSMDDLKYWSHVECNANEFNKQVCQQHCQKVFNNVMSQVNKVESSSPELDVSEEPVDLMPKITKGSWSWKSIKSYGTMAVFMLSGWVITNNAWLT